MPISKELSDAIVSGDMATRISEAVKKKNTEALLLLCKSGLIDTVVNLAVKENKEYAKLLPLDYLVNAEINENSANAKEINTELEKKLLEANCTLTKSILHDYYMLRAAYLKMNAIIQKNHYSEGMAYRNEAEKLMIELLKNAENKEQLNELEPRFSSENYLLKNRVACLSMFVKKAGLNYSSEEKIAIELSKDKYFLPAIFRLAEFHADHRNALCKPDPHFRRAITLNLLGLVLLSGLDNLEAAAIFLAEEKYIQRKRDEAIDFLKMVAESQNNKYKDYAKWAYHFVQLMLTKNFNVLVEDVDPIGFMLMALAHWDAVSTKYPEYTLSNHEQIQEHVLAGISKAFTNKNDGLSLKNLMRRVSHSEVIDLLLNGKSIELRSLEEKNSVKKKF